MVAELLLLLYFISNMNIAKGKTMILQKLKPLIYLSDSYSSQHAPS